MQVVCRNPLDDGNKKGGLKIVLTANSMIVFDKACNHYLQFAKWTQEIINFVCRLKSYAIYETQDKCCEKILLKNEFGVIKEENFNWITKKKKYQKTLTSKNNL